MSSSNDEQLSWLDSEFVKTILSKYEGHEKSDLSDFIVGGIEQGVNFAGVIKRLKINYATNGNKKTANFIIKTSPAAGAVSEFLEDLGIFEREVFTYEKIHRDCEALLPGFKTAPKLIYVDKNAMVLEDLKALNFELANRKQRLDVTQAKRVIEKVAKFHAISISLNEQDETLMEPYKVSAVDGDEMNPIIFFFSASLQEVLETIRENADLQRWLPYLENYDIVGEEKKVFSRNDTDRYHVLNHGDLWINNIFFKYNDKREPIESLLVDYQESYWGSPGIDFNHFLYTSCNYEVHDNHYDELIAFYHQQLSLTLKQLNYSKIPSLDDVQYEVKSKAQQGLIQLLSVVAIQMIENPEHANPENLVTDSEEARAVRRQVYGNPRYVEVLKQMLPKILGRGSLSQVESHF